MAIWRYSVTFGLAGCYMPDYYGGNYEGSTRRELMDLIRGEIEQLELPKYLIDGVQISTLWPYIKRHGSSSAHINLYYKHNVLSFHGLTEDEYNEAVKQEE